MTHGKLGGKVVVLTGGTSGIGRACAHLFCQEGASVVIGSIHAEDGSGILKEIEDDGRGQARFILTDVSQPEQVENLVNSAVAEFGRLDVLFGNAGILPLGTAWDTSVETWRHCIDVNLSGNFYLAKYGVPALIHSGGGVVLFTASELGLVGTTGGVAYCTSKGGVINMVRALALDCAPYAIRVNCLAPGPILTPMSERGFAQSENPGASERTQIEAIPLKRMGTPEEIARVALFLASDGSSYMTGSVVVADGGATAWYGM
jgi:meso-butanediol dehydrogenase / (S,S)-butanediol dehydrogenase / diacetyl reductase